MKIPMLDLPRQQQSIAAELEAVVRKVMKDARYVPGGDVSPFEAKLAAYCGRSFVVGVGSGTSALQIALLAAGVKPGDEVITVPNSFFATTEAVLSIGAVPRFVDVDGETHLMRVDLLAQSITRRTAAILPVHLFGNLVDVGSLRALLARIGREDVAVIEDCAHAAGASRDGRPVPLGGIGAFSFNPGKNIGALGDAGAIVTDDPAIATKARLLRDHGRASKNEHTLIGFNSRLGCLDDAVLAFKLDYLDRWNERRRAHAARYDALFASSAISPVLTERGVVPARHQYVVRVGNRDDVRARLADAGIDTMIHYPRLIVEQPPLRMLGWSAADVPMAAAVNEAMISIPCYPELEPQQVDFVAATLLACAVEANEEGAA